MEKIEIDALIKKAMLHDHEAQITLGEYYLNAPINSNSNFSRAEKYLRMAAEKHQKKAIELLIQLYIKYMEYLIKENKRYAQISMCFRLGVKWCKIGNNLGYNFVDYQNKIVEIFSKASEKNSRIDLNYKYKKTFKKNRIIICCVAIATLILFLCCLLIPPINKLLVWIFPLFIFVASIFVLIGNEIVLLKLLKNRKIASYMVNGEDLKTNNDNPKLSFKSNAPIYIKLKKIFNYDNFEKKNLNAIQRGLLGECFVEFLNAKKAKVLYSNLQLKLDAYGEKIERIEWINKGVETSDPFDFIIHTSNGKKFYMDVKTSWNQSNNVFMSNIQKSFYEKVINEGTSYFVCRLNNFWFKNVDDFLIRDSKQFIRIRLYDLKNEQERNKINIIYHEENNKHN